MGGKLRRRASEASLTMVSRGLERVGKDKFLRVGVSSKFGQEWRPWVVPWAVEAVDGPLTTKGISFGRGGGENRSVAL